MSDEDSSPAEVQRQLEAELLKDGQRLAHDIINDYWYIVLSLVFFTFMFGIISSGSSVMCCRCRMCECCRKTKCVKNWQHCFGLSGCMFFATAIVATAVWFLLEDAQDTIGLVSGGLLNQCVESLADSLVRNVESTGVGLVGTGSPWQLDLTNPVKEAVVIDNLDGTIALGSSQVATINLNSEHAPATLEPLVEGQVHIVAFVSLIGSITALLVDLSSAQLVGGVIKIRVSLKLSGKFGDKSYNLECVMMVPMSTSYLPGVGGTSGSVEDRLEQWAEALLEPNDEALPLKLSFIHGLRDYERTGDTMLQFQNLHLSGDVTTSSYVVFGTLVMFLCVIFWMMGEICGRTCIDQGIEAKRRRYSDYGDRDSFGPKHVMPQSRVQPPYFNQKQRPIGPPTAPQFAPGFAPSAPPPPSGYPNGSGRATGPPASAYGAPAARGPPSNWAGKGDSFPVPASSFPVSGGVPGSRGPPSSWGGNAPAARGPPSNWAGNGDSFPVPQSGAPGLPASQGPPSSWHGPSAGTRWQPQDGPASWTAPGPAQQWQQSGGVPAYVVNARQAGRGSGPNSWPQQGAPQGYGSWQGSGQEGRVPARE